MPDICLYFVYLSVCYQLYIKTTEQIFIKILPQSVPVDRVVNFPEI